MLSLSSDNTVNEIQIKAVSTLYGSARTARKGSTSDIRQNAHISVCQTVSEMLSNPIYSRYQKGLAAIQQRCTVCTKMVSSSQEYILNYIGIASIIEHLFHDIVPASLNHLQVLPIPEMVLEHGNLLQNFGMDDVLKEQILKASTVYRSTKGGLDAINSAVALACTSTECKFKKHCDVLEIYLRAGIGLPFVLAEVCEHPVPKRKLRLIQIILKYEADPNEHYWTRRILQKPPLAFQIATIPKEVLPLRCVQILIENSMDIAMTIDAQPSATASITATSAGSFTPLEAASKAKRMDLVCLYALNGLPVRYDLGNECSQSMNEAINYKNCFTALLENKLINQLGKDVYRLVLEYFPPKEIIISWIEEQENKELAAMGLAGRFCRKISSWFD